MTSDTELVERLREAACDIRNEQVASAIERLCAERDEAREGGTPEAKRLLAQIDALTKRAEEAEREVERLAPLAVAYDYLESPARADLAESALSAANAEVERLAALVERAFRDGLTYATNVVVTDPDAAWQFLRARAALQAEDKP